MILPKKIIRSRRRSIALMINSDAELIVKAPLLASNEDILQLVNEKQGWIEKHFASITAQKKLHTPITMHKGDVIMLLGTTYTIHPGGVTSISTIDTHLQIPYSCTSEQLIRWMKKKAEITFHERVRFYAKQMGLQYKTIKISSAKTRWGSCSHDNNLNFSWYLIMCPLSVIDYVIVHELSHIEHKNHSNAFWNRVEEVLPGYKLQRSWLKENGHLMSVL